MRTTTTVICVIAAVLLSLQPAQSGDLAALKPHMATTTPAGAGPFPAVMMASGCSGFGTPGGSYDEIQAQLTGLGFLVIRVDSLGARGQVKCFSGMVSRRDQAEDIQTAAAHLRRQANVRRDAINLVGWSWGGGATLAAAMVGEGIHAAVAYYPSCADLPDLAVNVPTLVLFGESDNVVSIRMCDGIFAASKSLTLRTYPGAHHGFDRPKLDPPRRYRFGTIGYNEAATKAAWTELEKFLKR